MCWTCLLDGLPCLRTLGSGGRLRKHTASATRKMDRLGYITADRASAFPGLETHPTCLLDHGWVWSNLDSRTGALLEGIFCVIPLCIEAVQSTAALHWACVDDVPEPSGWHKESQCSMCLLHQDYKTVRNQIRNQWRLGLGGCSAGRKAEKADERAFFVRNPAPALRQVFPVGSSKQTCKLLDIQEETA